MPISSLKYAHCQYPLPVRHRPKVPFHPRADLPPAFVERSARIHHLDRELDRFILSEADYSQLVSDAFSSNIHYSSRLEGNPLSLEEVRRLTRNSFEGEAPRRPSGPRQEIINHLLIWAAPDTLQTPWSLDTMARVHAFLLRGVEDAANPGRFREEESIIRGPQGEGHFNTAPPDRVVSELESLLAWLNGSGPAMRPEVAATLFFHEFESIHPFLDGNGRTGRSLFHAYLQNHGLKNASLCMVESKLLASPELYYRVLGWTDHSGGYLELLDFFTEALLEAYEEAAQRFGAKDLLAGSLDEHAKRLLVQSKVHRGWFSVGEASGWVGGRGDQTVRKHLNRLVEVGVLQADGRTRSKRYRFADPLAQFVDAAKAQQVPHQQALDHSSGPARSPQTKARPRKRRA